MMGRALSRLHDEFDVSVEQIEKLFTTIPFENKRIVQDLASTGNVSQIIISDANSLFISMILGFHKLESAFSAVFTNPAVVDKSGKICVSFFHENQTCDLCPVNLCKGRVLSEFLAKHKFEKIVYVGGAKSTIVFFPLFFFLFIVF
jgi:pyridoxal phosphate phosphatase PHOSPHO2